MKQFLLFAGDHYYPTGGANDLIMTCDSMEDCIKVYKAGPNLPDDYNTENYEWAHVLDIHTGEKTNITGF